ncbi:MAG: hypothetical protein PHY28_09515 [Dehalococcoidales bacterium]|nr:hypothetical protein [Dehalococcoidales bacterium]
MDVSSVLLLDYDCVNFGMMKESYDLRQKMKTGSVPVDKSGNDKAVADVSPDFYHC